MDMEEAMAACAALATPSRVKILQFLAEKGLEGAASGVIAERLGVPQNSMSTQLNALGNARLVRHRREGRNIIYSVDYDAMGGLIRFLANDCAAGKIKGLRVSG